MQIRKHMKGITRHYELTLNKEDAEELLSPDSQGVISPYAKDGVRFHLLPNPSVCSDAFRLMPDQDGYFAYIGNIKLRGVKDLEKLLQEKGEIPIEMSSTIPDNHPHNIGYVIIKIEYEHKQTEQSQQ